MLIAHLTWGTFLKNTGHAKCFFYPEGVDLKFAKCVPFFKIRKVVGFLFEARSNSKITLMKTECVVIYHGHHNVNHGYCEKMLCNIQRV